jgi:hypothetical protein
MVRAGKSLFATRIIGEAWAIATAAKSRGTSRPEPRLISGVMTVEDEAYISV